MRDDNGNRESMIQRVYRQIKAIDPQSEIIIATSKSQVSTLHNQLGEDINLSVEPSRKDTFPAISLAAYYLRDVLKCDESEPVVVCPVDPYVTEEYFAMLRTMCEQDFAHTNLYLMGIEPKYPADKYGYIIPNSKEQLSEVKCFKEKPTEKDAEKYIEMGALWNGGVFAFQLKYMLNKIETKLKCKDYFELYEKYNELTKISFDYAVVEEEKSIKVFRYVGQWCDIGEWNTLTNVMNESIVGDVTVDKDSQNINIINELDIPILAMGLNDVIIATSPDGILVSNKTQSGKIKNFADAIERDIRYAEKSWGCFKIIDVEKESLTIKVTIQAGDKMNYHSHKERDEVWIVIAGEGETIIDGMKQRITAGDVVTMQRGCRHTVSAITELHLIEVQLGKNISVNDKIKYKLEEW